MQIKKKYIWKILENSVIADKRTRAREKQHWKNTVTRNKIFKSYKHRVHCNVKRIVNDRLRRPYRLIFCSYDENNKIKTYYEFRVRSYQPSHKLRSIFRIKVDIDSKFKINVTLVYKYWMFIKLHQFYLLLVSKSTKS